MRKTLESKKVKGKIVKAILAGEAVMIILVKIKKRKMRTISWVTSTQQRKMGSTLVPPRQGKVKMVQTKPRQKALVLKKLTPSRTMLQSTRA